MKKVFSIPGILLFFTVAVFAQNNPPKGNWAKDIIGTSDYFLEIDDYTIKYVENKTNNYITWQYSLSDDGDYIIFGDIIEHSATTLKSEIYKPLYEDYIRSIKFERSGNKMTIYFNDKGVKFITKEAKSEAADAALGLGALIGGLIIKEATDTVATEQEVKTLADKVYDAAW